MNDCKIWIANEYLAHNANESTGRTNSLAANGRSAIDSDAIIYD
jgi:hypothetical protein